MRAEARMTREANMQPNDFTNNSRYEPCLTTTGVAWAVVQVRIAPDRSSAEGGFCGSAWVVNAAADGITFATAAHLLVDELFFPADQPRPVTHVWICNGDESFLIGQDACRVAGNDVAFVKVTPRNAAGRPVHITWYAHSKVPSDDLTWSVSAYNVGYPIRESYGRQFNCDIELPSPPLTFAGGPWMQVGNTMGARRITAATDPPLSNAGTFLLNYASEKGFSGGPVLDRNTNKILGMMCAVVPNNGLPPIYSLAISIEEISDRHQRVFGAPIAQPPAR